MTDQNPVPPALPPVVPPTASSPRGDGLTSTETILVVLGSLVTIWIVPLVLWIVWKDTDPEKARQSVKIGVLVAVVEVLFGCCFMSLYMASAVVAPVALLGMFGSMAGY